MPRQKPKWFLRFLGLKNLYLKPLRLLYPLIAVVLLFAFYQVFWGKILIIKNISCQIDNQACPPDLVNELEFLKDQRLLSFKPSLAATRLKKTNPYFQDVKFQVFYPDRVNVQITSEKDLIDLSLLKYTPTEISSLEASSSATPSASSHLFLSQLPTFRSQPFDHYFLNQSGELISSSDKLSTNYSAFLLIQTKLPEADILKNFYTLYHELFLSSFRCDPIWIYNSAAACHLKEGSLIIFSLTSDPRKSVASLQQIRSESTMNFDQSIIDLRFTNPVISNTNLEN